MKIDIQSTAPQSMTADQITNLAQFILSRKGNVDFGSTSVTVTPATGFNPDMAGIIVKASSGKVSISGATIISTDLWNRITNGTWTPTAFDITVAEEGDYTLQGSWLQGGITSRNLFDKLTKTPQGVFVGIGNTAYITWQNSLELGQKFWFPINNSDDSPSYSNSTGIGWMYHSDYASLCAKQRSGLASPTGYIYLAPASVYQIINNSKMMISTEGFLAYEPYGLKVLPIYENDTHIASIPMEGNTAGQVTVHLTAGTHHLTLKEGKALDIVVAS